MDLEQVNEIDSFCFLKNNQIIDSTLKYYSKKYPCTLQPKSVHLLKSNILHVFACGCFLLYPCSFFDKLICSKCCVDSVLSPHVFVKCLVDSLLSLMIKHIESYIVCKCDAFINVSIYLLCPLCCYLDTMQIPWVALPLSLLLPPCNNVLCEIFRVDIS